MPTAGFTISALSGLFKQVYGPIRLTQEELDIIHNQEILKKALGITEKPKKRRTKRKKK